MGVLVPMLTGLSALLMPDVAITVEQVHMELNRLRSKKVGGHDALVPLMLRLLVGVIAQPFTDICNDNLCSEAIPAD